MLAFPNRVNQHLQIYLCNYMRVVYTSKVTYRHEEDLLRCNPLFHGQSRYDSIIYETDQGEKFGRLVQVFALDDEVAHVRYAVALVQPFDDEVEVDAEKDLELGLYRVRMKMRRLCEVVPIHKVIRGALIMKDIYDEADPTMRTFFVMDTVDTDAFMRVRDLFCQRFSCTY